jgi:hypothetical protein
MEKPRDSSRTAEGREAQTIRAEPKKHFAMKSPNARPEKDQSGTSTCVTHHALPAVWIPDSTGGSALTSRLATDRC